MDFEAIQQLFDKVMGDLANLANKGIGAAVEVIRSLLVDVPKIVDLLLGDRLPPPKPDPASLRASADCLQNAAGHFAAVEEEFGSAVKQMGEEHWNGTAGTDARHTHDTVLQRARTVQPFTRQVAGLYDHYADEMQKIRDEHERLRHEVEHGSRLGTIISNAPLTLDPGEMLHYLETTVERIAFNIAAWFTTYRKAHEIRVETEGAVERARAMVEFPDALPAAMGAVEGLAVATSSLDDKNPDPAILRPGDAQRANDRLNGMSEADRSHVEDLLAKAKTPQERAWILKEVAAGGDMPTVDRFANRLGQMTQQQIAELNPTVYSQNHAEAGATQDGGSVQLSPLRQPDETTCGGSSVVYNRMLDDPAYAMKIIDGYDPKTGQNVTAPTAPNRTSGGWPNNDAANRFAADSKAAQLRMDATTGPGGKPQMPWPEALGSSPWGVAHEMEAGAGLPGSQYSWHATDPNAMGEEYQHIVQAAQSGHPVPLVVGNENYPHHYVTVTGVNADGSINVYEPGSGVTTTLTKEQYEHGDMKSITGDEHSKAYGTVLPQ